MSHNVIINCQNKPVGSKPSCPRPRLRNPQAERYSVPAWRRPVLSLPLAAGLPPLVRQKGWVCSLHSVTFANPSSTAQRGRNSPFPVVRGRKVKKIANIVFAIFSGTGRHPCRPHRHAGTERRSLPAPIFVFPSSILYFAPRLPKSDTASAELRSRYIYPQQPPYRNRNGGLRGE